MMMRNDREMGQSRISTVATVLIFVACVVVVASIILTACNTGPSLTQGEVVAKEYDDADDWYQSGYTISGGQTCTGGYGDQPRTCYDNADTHIPGQWRHEPERFLLKLRAPNPDDNTKTITDTVSVPEGFWDRIRVGQWVDVKVMEVIER